ncbi:MAG: polyprenol monophosphomannose synthase [Desulfurococcaceae archaeon]
MKTVSVVLPTYNERENIVQLIEQLAFYLKDYDYEIIVVDDNSPDGTAEVAESMKSKYPVRVIRRPGKLGLTSAIYEGVLNAKGEIVVVMDADLQHPPNLVPKLISKTDKCDVVIASRYIKGGGIEEWSLTRKIISIGAIILARLIVKECRSIKDPVSGFFAIKKSLLHSWKPLVPEGYKALVEILAVVKPKRICEEPYVFKSRSKGSSKLGGKIMLSYIKLLVKLSPLRTALLILMLITLLASILLLIFR